MREVRRVGLVLPLSDGEAPVPWSMSTSYRRYFTAALVIVAVGSAYLVGFVSRDQELFPSAHLLSVKTGIRALLPASPAVPSTTSNVLQTTLLRLRLDEIPVPVARAGAGGAMTSVGDDVLLLTHDGAVFAISGNEVRPTRIRVPDNGFEDYRIVAEAEPYSRLQHNLNWFRYNDILYYAEGENAGLVVSYTEWFPERRCYGTTLAMLALSPDQASVQEIESAGNAWQVIYTTQPCLPLKEQFRAIEGHMAGGRIAYRPPLRLLLGSGDYHWDGVYAPIAYAQDETADYGKIVEIDLVRRTARRVSMGNRNVQGLMTDHAGVVWSVEQGPRGGDELNRIEEGGNYGWPEATLGTRYNALPWPSTRPYGRHDGYSAPVFAWVPSVATSSIAEVRGFDPSWDGDFFVASLKGQSLFRLRVVDGRVLYSEPIPIGRRIRDVHQHTDGRLLLWTDSHRVVLITPVPGGQTLAYAEASIASMGLEPDRAERLRNTLDTCNQCHSFEPDMNEDAPSLANVFGAPIAARPGAEYSSGLTARRAAWSREELSRFLADPDTYAPGTTMPDLGLTPEAITDIITLLEALNAPE